MTTVRETLRELANSLRERPDEIVLDVGAGGELLVARIRLVATLLLMLLPLINYLGGGSANESLAGLAGTGAGTLLAWLWLILAKRRRRYPWLPFVTSASDISTETLVLMLLAATHSPAAGLNSNIVWPCYLLSIFATALRNDGRVTLLAGLLAMLQYGLLAAVILAQVPAGTVLSSPDYGIVSDETQIQRLVLIAVATLLTAVVVYRIQRLVLLSGTDTLTGLPNRSYLMHRVPQMIEAARDAQSSCSLAIIDLDLFKRINDTHGHPVGDLALKYLTGLLREQLGEDEALMRVGGEEFVLFVPLSIGPAWERVEALRKRVAATPFALNASAAGDPAATDIAITFSAGLASCPVDAVDLSNLLRRADQRLIKAKRSGRNRVVARE
ncbi:MAG: GGDEF domain-containing protein [Proteobacteria bacterium]|nr:GGDEF domain-containing protein [Pseudomonadota bacterium]